MGIDPLVSSIVNRLIDYGSHYALNDKYKSLSQNEDDSDVLRQLKFFSFKDLEKKFDNANMYVKSYYLHHLLDYFRETRYDIYNLELIFDKFLEEKIPKEFINKEGKVVNFDKEINEIFACLRKFQKELYEDLM
ncbi:MAG: hypothetical protein GF353_15715, partial [Candidatus Lokiarchaeota archaeon]|nr:hypothetical protein [Candidatus Lokiarchaeota archaeon]